MGELRTLLMGNYNDKFVFMTEEQKHEKFYQTAEDLQEDLVYLQLYVKRNHKSPFRFDVIPSGSCMDFRFWNDLFRYSYGGHTEIEYVRNMLSDYYLVKNFFEAINGETIESDVRYNGNTLKAIKSYFLSMHGIKLEDYVSCFIGCSHACDEILKACADL